MPVGRNSAVSLDRDYCSCSSVAQSACCALALPRTAPCRAQASTPPTAPARSPGRRNVDRGREQQARRRPSGADGAASTTIASGVVANGRAATAGMIRKAMMSRTPTIFMATAIVKARISIKRRFRAARIRCPRRRPAPRARAIATSVRQSQATRARTARAADEDPGEIGVGDREDVAEQVAHQVEPLARELGCGDKPRRQRRVREDAEQAVGRQHASGGRAGPEHARRSRARRG